MKIFVLYWANQLLHIHYDIIYLKHKHSVITIESHARQCGGNVGDALPEWPGHHEITSGE